MDDEIRDETAMPIDVSKYITKPGFLQDILNNIKPVDVSQFKLEVPEDGFLVKFVRGIGDTVSDVIKYGTVAYWILRFAWGIIEAVNKLKGEKK